MRKITTLFFALSVVGSLSLTSCKDYSEDDYNTQMTVMQGMKDDLQQQINDLTTKFLSIKECTCQQVTITKNNDGTYTISNKDGVSVTVPADAAEKPQTDANGTYVIGADGKKVYIPMIVKENDKTFIKIGNEKYELVDPGTGSSSEITIDGNKITIKVGDKTWEFDNTAGTGTTFEYDETNKTYTAGDGDKKITLPAGNYELKDNGNGTVTITVGGESATLVKKPVEVSVTQDAAGNDVLHIKVTDTDGQTTTTDVTIPKGSTTPGTDISGIIKDLYGEGGSADTPIDGSLFDRMKKEENSTVEINNALYGVNGTAASPKEGSILYRMNKVEQDLANLSEAFKKLVTGIIVQDVVNPAFGSYSSLLTNLQTNMLLAYHGTIASTRMFPESEIVDPVEKVWAGAALNENPGNAGVLYLTINPNTVDFSGLELELVNTKDEPCGIKLGAARKTTADDSELTFGFTRSAEDNGLYVIPATLSKDAVDNQDLKIDIPADTYKKFASDLLKAKNKSAIKPIMKDLAAIAVESAQAIELPKQGVKCSWTDYNGTHSVYSNYNISAVAFQPLGFYSVDGLFVEGGQYWRGYDKAKGLVAKLAKRVGRGIVSTMDKQLGLDKISTDIGNIKIDQIDMIELTDEQKKKLKVTFSLDTTLVLNLKVSADLDLSQALDEMTIYTEYEYKDGNVVGKEESKKTLQYLKDENKITVNTSVAHVPAGTPGAHKIEIKFIKSFTVDMTGPVEEMLAGINAGFSDTNKLLDALQILMDDTNDMLANIRKMEEKLENGTYLNRVYKYLDKIADRVAVYTPMLFKPVLLMNSDEGFGLVGSEGAYTEISSTKVTLIPTTYSAELLSPIYKKYIRVGDDGEGQIVDGKTIEVTLKPGENKIYYYALDYQGKQYPEIGNDEDAVYVIYVK